MAKFHKKSLRDKMAKWSHFQLPVHFRCCTTMPENHRRSAVLEIFKPVHLAATIRKWWKSLRSHFFLILCLMWALPEAPDLWLYDFMHCNTAIWLVYWIIAWITRCVSVPKKCAVSFCTYLRKYSYKTTLLLQSSFRLSTFPALCTK